MSDVMDFSEINELINQEEARVSPVSIDQAIELIKKSVDLTYLCQSSTELAIQSLQDARSAVEMANQSRKIKNRLETTRSGILRPNIDFQKAINKVVKEVEKELDKIESNLKEKLTSWMASPTSFVPDRIETDEGTLTRTKKWSYYVVDTERMPSKYLCADCKEIERSIDAGIREIEGVEIFEKEEISFRVKNG